MKADVETWIPLGATVRQIVDKIDPHAEKERQALAAACRRVEAEWQRTGHQAPTIAGVPISRELAGMLNVQGRREEAA